VRMSIRVINNAIMLVILLFSTGPFTGVRSHFHCMPICVHSERSYVLRGQQDQLKAMVRTSVLNV
jgi:hypothetical protein